MNTTTRRFLEAKRADALKIVEACDLMLSNEMTTGEPSLKTRESPSERGTTKGFGERMLDLLLKQDDPKTVGEMCSLIQEKAPEIIGNAQSDLSSRVSASLRYSYQRGTIGRRKKNGAWHYYVKG